ncbi:histidine phosphatase family protein [Isoptericola variabilis]|uniref:Putative phosphohistidine phosphatase, SixA n=1 Tax=Isoptericola variabilis (strain 225) TaxID=743718 RepID=F6FT78_ISOV2|nr:histidine phosphatase family protein [Isoptericola variabilis]AEG44149.1 putative phosphohistidine phosphatase, SixA [Isoptericola variabilis 225]TWH28537.1 phosphohistidine phosphatase [Isoptericola variabilis J7]
MNAAKHEDHATTAVRRLVLLRHAKAEPVRDTGTDAERPLALKGRRQASGVGMALTAAGLVPDLALVSSALRTRQTWDLARAHLDGVDAVVEVRDELYEASVGDVLDLVRAVDPDVGTVLVLGHEPTMAATAAYLAGPGSDDAALAQVRVGVPTATYSVLESAEHPWSEWGKGAARLVHVGRPS